MQGRRRAGARQSFLKRLEVALFLGKRPLGVAQSTKSTAGGPYARLRPAWKSKASHRPAAPPGKPQPQRVNSHKELTTLLSNHSSVPSPLKSRPGLSHGARARPALRGPPPQAAAEGERQTKPSCSDQVAPNTVPDKRTAAARSILHSQSKSPRWA